MDKFLIRKDVYDELIEKGYGKRDLSKLTKKQITDKNGHKRTVYVKNGEQPVTQKQTKTDELTPEKKAIYEEMLAKVKAGSDENALFVRDKGMLNKKDAIAHLEGKLGKKTETKLTQDDTKEKLQATRTSKADKEESESNSEEGSKEKKSEKETKASEIEKTSDETKNDIAKNAFDKFGQKKLAKLGFEPKGDSWVCDIDGRKEEIKIKKVNSPNGEWATAQLYVNGNKRGLNFGGVGTLSTEKVSSLESFIKEQRKKFQPVLSEKGKEQWRKKAEKYTDKELKEIIDSFPNPKGLLGSMFGNPSVQKIVKEEYEKRMG